MAYGSQRYKTSERVCSRREDGEEIAQQLIEHDTIQNSIHWDEWCDSYGMIWCGDEACACARPPETVTRPRRKDCRRWCLGKVGRTHKPEWQSYDAVKHNRVPLGRPCSRWRLLVCTACGRHLDYDFPWFS